MAVEYLDRYQYFLLPAILLLALEVVLTDRRKIKMTSKRIGQKVPAGVATIMLLLMTMSSISAKENVNSLNSKGNNLYKAGKFQEAAKLYEEAAVEKPEEFALQYNLANALQQGQDQAKALNTYLRALELADTNQMTQTFYNLGNNLFRIGQYQEAAAAYQKTLEYDPSDWDAKFNYELALKKMQEQSSQPQPQKQKQQQQNQPQNQQNQQEEQQQRQQQQKQEKSEEQQKEQEQSQPQKQEEQQKQPEEKPSQSQLNKEEAERILEALEQKEKEQKQEKMVELQKKLMRQGRQGKDW